MFFIGHFGFRTQTISSKCGALMWAKLGIVHDFDCILENHFLSK
jgi:hypothetical protein